MSDRIQVDGEALSALMDSELSEFELRRLLARISEEPELLATWQRYNLVRAAFQPEPLRLPMTDSKASGGSLSDRIMAAVEIEPAFDNARSSESDRVAATGVATSDQTKAKTPLWTTQFARVAVAASVALAVFVGMQSVLNTPDSPTIANQSSTESRTESSTTLQQPAMASGDNVQLAVDADAQQRLNDYIRSVSIPSRAEPAEGLFNILRESPMLHPVSDLELVQEVERSEP